MAAAVDRAAVIGYMKGIVQQGLLIALAYACPPAGAVVGGVMAWRDLVSFGTTAEGLVARKTIQTDLNEGKKYDDAVWFYYQVHHDIDLW